MLKEEFIKKLYETGAIKFGSFTLKSGLVSPFYIDLREVVSDVKMLKMITDLLYEKIKDLKYDLITGIPYTALPFATLVADKLGKPLIFLRKEKKLYGTGNDVIGKYRKNDVCLVIDDLITTGLSKIETANKLEREGIEVNDFVVIIDRSKNGKDELKKAGYNLHSIISLDEITSTLKKNNLLSEKKIEEIWEFVNNSEKKEKQIEISPFAKKLREKIIEKQSNLVLSLDVDNRKEFFEILQKVAKSIVMLKTHIDIINDFDDEFIEKLKEFQNKYGFMILEDRKFADIGNTVKMQYHKGVFKISSWSDFVTVHLVAGEGTLRGLFENFDNGSAFILGRMSSKNNLIDENYTKKAIKIASEYSGWVSGFIGHGKDADDLRLYKNMLPKGMLLLVPGVKLKRDSDKIGQQYISVKEAMEGGADCIIVGRGILKSKDVSSAAEEYRKTAWEIYKKSIG